MSNRLEEMRKASLASSTTLSSSPIEEQEKVSSTRTPKKSSGGTLSRVVKHVTTRVDRFERKTSQRIFLATALLLMFGIIGNIIFNHARKSHVPQTVARSVIHHKQRNTPRKKQGSRSSLKNHAPQKHQQKRHSHVKKHHHLRRVHQVHQVPRLSPKPQRAPRAQPPVSSGSSGGENSSAACEFTVC